MSSSSSSPSPPHKRGRPAVELVRKVHYEFDQRWDWVHDRFGPGAFPSGSSWGPVVCCHQCGNDTPARLVYLVYEGEIAFSALNNDPSLWSSTLSVDDPGVPPHPHLPHLFILLWSARFHTAWPLGCFKGERAVGSFPLPLSQCLHPPPFESFTLTVHPRDFMPQTKQSKTTPGHAPGAWTGTYGTKMVPSEDKSNRTRGLICRLHAFELWHQSNGTQAWTDIVASERRKRTSSSLPWELPTNVDFGRWLLLETQAHVDSDHWGFYVFHVLIAGPSLLRPSCTSTWTQWTRIRGAWTRMEQELWMWRMNRLGPRVQALWKRACETSPWNWFSWNERMRRVDSSKRQHLQRQKVLLTSNRHGAFKPILSPEGEDAWWQGSWAEVDLLFQWYTDIQWIHGGGDGGDGTSPPIWVSADEVWHAWASHWMSIQIQQTPIPLTDVQEMQWWMEWICPFVAEWEADTWHMLAPKTKFASIRRGSRTKRGETNGDDEDDEDRSNDAEPLDFTRPDWFTYLPPCFRYLREIYLNPQTTPDMHMGNVSRFSFLGMFKKMGYRDWDQILAFFEGSPLLTPDHARDLEVQFETKKAYTITCDKIADSGESEERRRWCPHADSNNPSSTHFVPIEGLGAFAPAKEKCRKELQEMHSTTFRAFHKPVDIARQLSQLAAQSAAANPLLTLDFEV